ncbi:ribonuclease E inhibitor RraB [Geopseudomonas guangdongensis]|uniref:Regulator of ribonuclease activity B n=1 Tax=Geopseudomonas guangdongensis TaxID=1245526 RepID=A0A1H2IFL4_9GAMM|nr:ribonuclease E inhibitor RraB [Pseudomonas guangdongensis]SDU42940.1 Regulator of ribonuclease activity B [Pseudomonas guangdongensis]
MARISPEDIGNTVLRQMREGGFDFARVHPIEFYAIFADEAQARRAAGQFRGEWLNAQVCRRDGAWHLQVSKVMYATRDGIDDFEHDLQAVVGPLGGILDGWGVTQEVSAPPR